MNDLELRFVEAWEALSRQALDNARVKGFEPTRCAACAGKGFTSNGALNEWYCHPCKGTGFSNGRRPASVLEKIALMHSELGEATEAYRHGNKPSEHIPEFTGIEEEEADVVIRIMHEAKSAGRRLGDAIVAKMKFNATREFMHGGKII